MSSGNIAYAAYFSAFIESTVNEAVDYLSGKKDLTKDNLSQSANKVNYDTFYNGTEYFIGGGIANGLLPAKGMKSTLRASIIDLSRSPQRVSHQTLTQALCVLLERPFFKKIASLFNNEFVW